jgi:hypothetical protein
MRPRLLPFELAWTDAAFDAIFPDGTALPHGVARLHPARFFDELLVEIPLEQSLGLRVALWIVALAPLFTIRKLGTIASIEPAERTRVLERLLASPTYAVRQLTLGLKAMAALLYVQSSDVRAAMTEPVRGPAASSRLVTLRTSQRPSDPPPSHGQGGSHEHAAE